MKSGSALFAKGLICAAMVMALSACGHADNAAEAGSADNVEIPAEEAMSGLPAGAVPVGEAETVADSAGSAE